MENGKQLTPKAIAALVQQLPAEMQLKLVEPNPVYLQAFEDMVSDVESLRYNLTKLLVDHLRNNELPWDDDEFEDFHILCSFLEHMQYQE